MNYVEPMKYDLSTCDKEPIHRLGKIQSNGALIAFSADWLIIAHSDNVAEMSKRDASDLIGTQLADFLHPIAVAAVTKTVSRIEDEDQLERLLGIELFAEKQLFDVTIHFSQDLLIMEFEPATSSESSRHTDQLRTALRMLSRAVGVDKICQQAAISVGQMIGFDRVMIYKFHPDGSGEVIAEHRESDVDSFMGLRYPASDIPAQARALYKRSVLRLIADIEDPGIEITPRTVDLDMSLCTLRSVSPMHIEYLRNMGIKSSLSISILIDGELWGLIACHNYSVPECSMSCKTHTELYAESFALTLRSALSHAANEGTGGAQKLHLQMMSGLNPSQPLFSNLLAFAPKIKSLIECDSLVLSIDGERSVIGDPVSSEDVDLLVKRLNRQATTKVTAVENLGNWLDAEATVSERFAGLLAVPISKRPRDLLLFLRREEAVEVKWAGNPEKPVELGPNGSRLTPRKSFAAWVMLREGFCRPWTSQDINLANELKGTLLELVVRNIDERSKIASDAQQQQDMLIHELNHRVRNILGLINSIVGQTATSVGTVDEFKGILAGRIQALALAQNQLTERNWSNTPFRTLLDTELNAFVATPDRMKMSGPDILLTPKAYTTLTLLIHELITNAMKHGAMSTPAGTIEFTWQLDKYSNLEMYWGEFGVTVAESPKRRGFGSLIIERAIPLDLGGEAEYQVTRDGLQARFLIPNKHFVLDGPAKVQVDDKDEHESESDSAAPHSRESDGDTAPTHEGDNLGTALIVEDNMIIAIDEESTLTALGFSQIHIATSVASAMQVIARGAINFAVLDVNLGIENSEPIAEELARKEIPFLFASGYDLGLDRLTAKFNAPLVKKPFTSDGLTAAVKARLKLK